MGDSVPRGMGAEDGANQAPPRRVPMEELLEGSFIVRDGLEAVALWMPDAPEHAALRDTEAWSALREFAGSGNVLVFGGMRGGHVMAGDRVVSPSALSDLISLVAPGRVPILTMAGADDVAPRLAGTLGLPVVASRYGARFDPVLGTLTEALPPEGTAADGRGLELFGAGEGERQSFEASPITPWAASAKSDGLEETAQSSNSREPDPHVAPPSEAGPLAGLGAPVEVPADVRSRGVPRAGLPFMPQVLRTLRAMAAQLGATVPEREWNGLPHRLLSNYRYLVPEGEGGTVDGFVMELGDAEVLVTLDPRDPREVSHPAASFDSPAVPAGGQETTPSDVTAEQQAPLTARPPKRDDQQEAFHAVGTTNAAFQLGTYSQTHSGATGATRVQLSGGFGTAFGTGVLENARAFAAVSLTQNASQRSTNILGDAEGGHVEETRDESRLIAYRPHWELRMRRDTLPAWADVPPVLPVDGSGKEAVGDERLMLWIPEHYLEKAPAHVTAVNTGGRESRLPQFHYAAGLTGLPALLDTVLSELERQGVDLPVGGSSSGRSFISPRSQLVQKIWALDAHLDEAAGPDGYPITLINENRARIATVTLYAQRMPTADRVGATSRQAPDGSRVPVPAHIENVRTAIDGTGGNHTITSGWRVSAGAEVNLLPVPFAGPDVGVGGSASLSVSGSDSHGLSASRVGLWVVVPRYKGFTSAYRVDFRYTAFVAVRGSEGATTPAVPGRALLRIPEPEAFKYGFPVDRDAVTGATASITEVTEEADAPAEIIEVPRVPETASGDKAHAGGGTDVPVLASGQTTVEYRPDLLRGTAREPVDHQRPLPPHAARGRGIGMGMVQVGETARNLSGPVKEVLQAHGFLPQDTRAPLSRSRWYTHGNTIDAQAQNLEVFNKYFTDRGLESHWDELFMDGLSITMRRPTGTLGLDFDVDAVKITIKAAPTEKSSPRFLGPTDEWHTVNLAMGMDTVTQSTSGVLGVGLEIRPKTFFSHMKASTAGVGLSYKKGAGQTAFYLNNRPELLEFPGTVNEFSVKNDFTVTFEFQHSGMSGEFRKGIRDPAPLRFPGQDASLFLLDLGEKARPDLRSKENLKSSVLDRAAIFYLDTQGLREAATTVLAPLTGPQGNADAEINSLTGNIQVKAHLKEIVNGQFTTDQLFKEGWFRDGHGLLDINGQLRQASFYGATDDKFVLGIIKLHLGQGNTADLSSKGFSWLQAETSVGGSVEDGGSTQGGASSSRNWGWNTSLTASRTAGKERIQLDFNRAYAIRTKVNFSVSSRLERDGKLAPRKSASRKVTLERDLIFLLSEPEALEQYGQGAIPLPHDQLLDAMRRWSDGELRLSGNIVASVLTRWATDPVHDPMDSHPRSFADTLAALHRSRGLPILDDAVRTAFNQAFERQEAGMSSVFDDMEFPEYLTREDPGGRMLGHSGVHDLTYDDGRTTYDIVRRLVDRTAPGLLTSKPWMWTRDGSLVGRLQGGVNSLQALLAKGRDQAMWDEFLSPNGFSFFLVNPVGWALSDIVEINVSDVLEGAPKTLDFRGGTGLEVYNHGYVETGQGQSRDGAQNVGIAFGGAEDGVSSNSNAGVGEGHHRSVNRFRNEVTEQTAYDWNGNYLVEFRHRLKVEVRRLDLAGRPVNNLLTSWYRSRDAFRSEVNTASVAGKLVIRVPRGLAEFRAVSGPRPERDLRPLPPLPGDAFVAGALLDEGLPAARKLLRELFGTRMNSAVVHTGHALPQFMGRFQMSNHVLEATAGKRYLITENLHVPGKEYTRARLYMTGDLFDLRVLGAVSGSGTGRYIKASEGTSSGQASDRSGPSTGVGVSGGESFSDHDASSGPALSRLTTSSASGGMPRNVRPEQHVKMQGPMQLVVVRGRFRLEAEPFAWAPPKEKRRGNAAGAARRVPPKIVRTDAFTGDVYMELYQAEVEELLARVERTEHPRVPAVDWQEMRERAQHFDLAALLAEAAEQPGAAAARAHEVVARLIRQRTTRAIQSVSLVYDEAGLARSAVRATARWAVGTIGRGIEGGNRAHETEARELLLHYRRLSDSPPPVPTRSAVWETVRGVLDGVENVTSAQARQEEPAGTSLSGRPSPPLGGPPILGFLSLSPADLLRNIAHELDAYVIGTVEPLDGRRRTLLVNPFMQGLEGLLAGLDDEVRPAVRRWDPAAADQVEVLRRILRSPGARSLVFGTRLNHPVWAFRDEHGDISWRTLDVRDIPAPDFADGLFASIDIDHLGRLTGPALEEVRRMGEAARPSPRTDFCALNQGADPAGVVGWRGPVP
ncbi:hypothetical protein [Streptomyces sp. NPDC014676]|uniref:hypothetical protein n=1 Tax=Streptomyces sp. NPDC014676 TaxID=3364879 RepID=UPI0036FB444B